jgi:hypothetical protein
MSDKPIANTAPEIPLRRKSPKRPEPMPATDGVRVNEAGKKKDKPR